MTGMATNDPNAPPETEVKAGFQAMLEELKVNSRPHLTTLTILAGEYRQFAKQIVGLIEAQLARVRKYRLPIMYLIDSIVKEFPEDYVPIFSNNLVKLFAETFKVQAEFRTKLYDLRNTWDEVFAPSLLYTLDTTVRKLDRNWPVRVHPVKPESLPVNSRTGNNAETTSDEFSSASDNDDASSKRKRSTTNSRRQQQQQQAAAESGASNKQRTISNGPNVGSTGMVVKESKQQQAAMEQLAQPSTPTSVHSLSVNEGHSPPPSTTKSTTKSRPPSNVGTVSPRSTSGSVDGTGLRQNRVQSLDERLSSLSESRAQSEASDTSFDNTLAIDENISINSPRVEKLPRGNFRHFVPPSGLSSSRFDSPSDLIGRRGSRGSLPGSAVSSPRVFNKQATVTSIQLGRNRTETGVQVKTSSTTRSVQTGQFQKEASTMATVTTADASTQKKLRKPKQTNFMQQFRGCNKSQAVQAAVISKSSSSQWNDNDCTKALDIGKEISKGFEFRNAVTRFLSAKSARAADSILRRLHEHQKSNQLCDLTISLGVLESDKIRCHKYIVAMVSDVIQSESVMKDEIIFSNIKKDILNQLIDYCYTQMIGPFVDKAHVAGICDGIKKLKIRQLDPVVDMIEVGQRKGVDYCGAAISGMELVSANIVTAAMLGQAIPAEPLSSLGLVDLQENGVSDFLPDLDSEDEENDENNQKSPVKINSNQTEKKIIRSEEAIPLKKRKSIVRATIKETTNSSSNESSSSSNDNSSSSSSSDDDDDNNIRQGKKMVLDKQGGTGRPRRKLVQLTQPKTLSPKVNRGQIQRSPARSSVEERISVPKKRKVQNSRENGNQAQKSKRPRRKTSEGKGMNLPWGGFSVDYLSHVTLNTQFSFIPFL
jgi:hypothetical protein